VKSEEGANQSVQQEHGMQQLMHHTQTAAGTAGMVLELIISSTLIEEI
jgi:hypothetical protein